MIDWELTRRELGDVDLSDYRPKVMVRCDICNVSSKFTIRVKSRIKGNHIDWLCYKCANNRKRVRQKHSIQMKKQWADEEYKRQRSECSKQLWHHDKFRSNHREGVRAEESRRKCSEAATEAWKRESYRNKHAVALSKQLSIVPDTERRTHSILDALKLSYDINYVVGPYTFDIHMKRKDAPDLLIEINGNYWHTRPYVARKDMAKASYISAIPDYELKTIWEHQLFDIGRCKCLISYWMGLDHNRRRRIKPKQVVFSECEIDRMRDFMSNYHYLGSMGRAGIHIAGTCTSGMVCGMVFAHPTRKEIYSSMGHSKQEVLELTRFCISPHVDCKNLASYALARAITFIPSKIKCLVSFASPGDGHYGTIYEAANWEFVGETARSYFYINKDGWKMHKRTLYGQARGMHMSESEFADRFDYVKIWMPPLRKYKLTLS